MEKKIQWKSKPRSKLNWSFPLRHPRLVPPCTFTWDGFTGNPWDFHGLTEAETTETTEMSIWLVVYLDTYPSEKCEFVSWDDDIPNWMEKKCSKPPIRHDCRCKLNFKSPWGPPKYPPLCGCWKPSPSSTGKVPSNSNLGDQVTWWEWTTWMVQSVVGSAGLVLWKQNYDFSQTD